MIRIKAKKILLVAPESFSKQLLDTNEEVRHVVQTEKLFPVIFDYNPELIVFDYDYLGADFERILRRIRTNTFYKRTKICCYKPKAERKVDSLLSTLGVNYFLHEPAAKKVEEATSNFTLPEAISKLFQSAVLNVAVQ